MKKTLIRLMALALVLVLCASLVSAVYATETRPQETEQPAEPKGNDIDWTFWLSAIALAIASILHTRNQIRRREQRR